MASTSNRASFILSDMEWDEGLSMPVANAENQALEKLIQTRQTTLVALQNEVEDHEDLVKAMSDHLTNLKLELQTTQGLGNARESELQTEEHILKLTLREKSRLKQEVARFMKLMDVMKSRRESFQSNISRMIQKILKLQSDLNWDQKALDQWLVESSSKDDDAMTIQKYTRQDEVKIKELSFSIEKLIVERLQKEHQLQNEVTNTVTCQIELDKTAENFRTAHLEREELLTQWANTIELMQRRDRDIDMLATKLAESKQKIRRYNNIMNSKLQHLERERENNKNTENRISLVERTSIFTKKELSQVELQKAQFENETEAQKRTLERMVLDLELARVSVFQVKQEIKDKNHKLLQAQGLRETLDQKLKSVVASTLSAGDHATQIDDMLIAEEKKQVYLNLHLKGLEGILCKAAKELATVRSEEKTLEAAINSAKNTSKNLASKQRLLDSDTLKQQEILYSQDLIILQMENRCLRMQGEQTSEETIVLEAKIKELQKELDSRNHTLILLVAQLRKTKEHQRLMDRYVSKCVVDIENLRTKIDECNLYVANAETELVGSIKRKQDLMVSQNLLKLEVRKIQDMVNSKADTILSLEMRKLQLDTTMKERRLEIKIYKKMLKANIKVTEEQRAQIAEELREKMSNIENMKTRYQFMIISMGPPSQDVDECPVYCLIKTAQEKEALQREGDDLDAKIRKAEKEILALENTLNLMNGRNDLYQQSFKQITKSSEEMNIKHELNERMSAVMDKYKYKKRQIKELHTDVKTATENLEKLLIDEEGSMAAVLAKKDKTAQLNKEIQEQREKIKRASKQNVRLLREIRSSKHLQLEELLEEKDIKVREQRDLNKSLMNVITEAAQHFPEMQPLVQLYFEQADLALSASTPGSTLGSQRASLLSFSKLYPDSSTELVIQDAFSITHTNSPTEITKQPEVTVIRPSPIPTDPQKIFSSTGSENLSIESSKSRSRKPSMFMGGAPSAMPSLSITGTQSPRLSTGSQSRRPSMLPDGSQSSKLSMGSQSRRPSMLPDGSQSSKLSTGSQSRRPSILPVGSQTSKLSTGSQSRRPSMLPDGSKAGMPLTLPSGESKYQTGGSQETADNNLDREESVTAQDLKRLESGTWDEDKEDSESQSEEDKEPEKSAEDLVEETPAIEVVELKDPPEAQEEEEDIQK